MMRTVYITPKSGRGTTFKSIERTEYGQPFSDCDCIVFRYWLTDSVNSDVERDDRILTNGTIRVHFLPMFKPTIIPNSHTGFFVASDSYVVRIDHKLRLTVNAGFKDKDFLLKIFERRVQSLAVNAEDGHQELAVATIAIDAVITVTLIVSKVDEEADVRTS